MRSPGRASACAASIASATCAWITTSLPSAPNASAIGTTSPARSLSLRAACATSASAASGRTMPATSLSALIETMRWRRSQLKNSAQRDGQCLGARRVVRAVQQDRGLARDDLHAAGPAHAIQRRAHRGLVEGPVHEGFERDDRRGRVPDRVLPEHRQVHVLVGAVHPPQEERLPAHRQETILDLPVAELPEHRGTDLVAPGLDHVERPRSPVPARPRSCPP